MPCSVSSFEGYLQLQSELPLAYHARMYDELEPLDETGPAWS